MLDVARDYLWAAETLLKAVRSESKMQQFCIVRPSINFAVFHSVETSLKAAIVAMGGEARHHHRIKDLYRDAAQLGLVVPEDPRQFQRNEGYIGALHNQNFDHAFRYFDGVHGNSADGNALYPFARDVFQAAERVVLERAPTPPATPRIRFVEPFQVIPGDQEIAGSDDD